jgi:UDP-2,4-diacetamido-2,4,6-trideoxy-beta-L-altropyranose hydrolase
MALNIAFRVDASAELGIGHLTRCLTLADALHQRGARLRFVCGPLPAGHGHVIQERGYELATLPSDGASAQRLDATRTASALAGERWDWVVVDRYTLGAEWERAIRLHAARILAIDDLADRGHDCDVLLDQNYLPHSEARYRGKVPAACQLLLGPWYALLRPEYGEHRATLPGRQQRVERLLVFFGGTDPHGMTELALEALSSPDLQGLIVDVVYAGDASRRSRIEALAAQRPGTTVHGPRPHLADLMAQANLSLGGGGSTSWERMCLGLRSLVITLAANQREVAAWLDARGLARLIGDAATVTEADIRRALVDEVRREGPDPAVEEAMRLCDGRGTPRVADAMLSASDDAMTLGSRKGSDVF